MLEVIYCKNGNIGACIDFWIVDSLGRFDPKGEYCWINELQLSKEVRGQGKRFVAEFIKRITKMCPQLKAGYFKREKYNGKITMYSKRRWLKFADKYGGEDELI